MRHRFQNDVRIVVGHQVKVGVRQAASEGKVCYRLTLKGLL